MGAAILQFRLQRLTMLGDKPETRIAVPKHGPMHGIHQYFRDQVAALESKGLFVDPRYVA